MGSETYSAVTFSVGACAEPSATLAMLKSAELASTSLKIGLLRESLSIGVPSGVEPYFCEEIERACKSIIKGVGRLADSEHECWKRR
jgi:hypothetical protein